jgi:hypothetical protein
VAKGWSGYFVGVLEILGIELPPGLYAATAGFYHDFVVLPRRHATPRGMCPSGS